MCAERNRNTAFRYFIQTKDLYDVQRLFHWTLARHNVMVLRKQQPSSVLRGYLKEMEMNTREKSTRFLWVGRAAEEDASSPIPLGRTCKLTPTQQRRIARVG